MVRDEKGRFMKGHVPCIKGNRSFSNCLCCDKQIRIFKSRQRKFCNHSCAMKFQWKNGITIGKKASKKTKIKMSLTNKGMKNSGRFKKGHTPWSKGKKTGLIPWSYIDGRSKILGPARYGDDWDKIRYLVYLRDRFTCQHCAVKGERLDVHHKIPFLISFDNSLNNLISLCKPCHRKEEARIMRELKSQKVEV